MLILAHAKINWFEIYQKIQLDYIFLKLSLDPKIVFYSHVGV